MDFYQLVKENVTERSELTKRQDADVLLRNLAAYVMKSFDGKTTVEGIINVTLNRPKVMSSYIIAALGKTSEQIAVETEDRKLDTDYIKDFRRLAFLAADARLQRQNLGKLNPYLDEQACIRGGAAARCLFQMVNGVLIPDITCWDYRYVNYEMGADGFSWAAYGFGTKRKKAVIESEGWAKGLKLTIPKEAEVVDVWTPEGNEVWLDGKKVFEQGHSFGFTPVVIQTVSLGSMLSDKDDIKNQAESVFFLIREAIPELNRLASILQTLALNVLKPPAENVRKEGATAVPPTYTDVMTSGAMSSADIGGGTRIINQADANRAAQMALAMMDKNMNEGGFSTDIFNAPLGSGIAILQAKEGKDVIYLSRLDLKASTKQALGDMFTAQVIQIGGAVEVGTPGHKRKFDTGKLEGQYEVTHQFSVKSLVTQAGLASLAAALGNSIPERAKRREILGREDPDGDERWLRWEEAERLSPLIKLRRIAADLIELDEDEEAKLITDEAGVQLAQLLSGNATLPPKTAEIGKEPTQVLGLFGGTAGRQQKSQMPQPVEEA